MNSIWNRELACSVRSPCFLSPRMFGWVLASLLLATFGVTDAAEPAAPKFVLEWGKKGDQPGEFYSPIGIAINKRDEIFITDLNNARVQKFSSDGKHLGGFDLPRDTPDRKSSQAGGIAIDEQGLLYLGFMQQDAVRVYSEDGKVVREWGKKGKSDGELNGPGGILLAADGNVYVADQRNHRVQKFTREGKFLAKWGEHGSNPGQFGGKETAGSRFGGPHFLSQDSQGRIYSTEGADGRVQQFASDGKPLLVWGDKGEQPGGFGAYKFANGVNTLGPIGILVDRHDRVWVSSLNDRVQAFTPEGKFILQLGDTGDEPGNFHRPHGMAIDSKGFFYVCDAGNQRIQKFELQAP